MLVIERESLLFLRLLQAAQSLQIFGVERDFAFQNFQKPRSLLHSLVLRGDLSLQLAKLAFERQRTASSLLAAAYGVAVIAHSIGQEKERVRIANGEPLRRRTIRRQIAVRKPRQQI